MRTCEGPVVSEWGSSSDRAFVCPPPTVYSKAMWRRPDPEVFGVVLCGLHKLDGLSRLVPREVIQAGCVLTEERGEPVVAWEPNTDRAVMETPRIVRHWHTDWTRTEQGVYRFHLVEDGATP